MSKNDELTVSVVTPAGSVYEGTASLAICSTPEGKIGIMPNRLPLLTTLVIDEVKIQQPDGSFENIAISGGFLEFSNNELSIVAPAAERAEDIDVERAMSARDRAQKRIAEAKSNKESVNDLERAEIALKRAINRLNISKG